MAILSYACLTYVKRHKIVQWKKRRTCNDRFIFVFLLSTFSLNKKKKTNLNIGGLRLLMLLNIVTVCPTDRPPD